MQKASKKEMEVFSGDEERVLQRLSGGKGLSCSRVFGL